jgi:hypothetical protein
MFKEEKLSSNPEDNVNTVDGKLLELIREVNVVEIMKQM